MAGLDRLGRQSGVSAAAPRRKAQPAASLVVGLVKNIIPGICVRQRSDTGFKSTRDGRNGSATSLEMVTAAALGGNAHGRALERVFVH